MSKREILFILGMVFTVFSHLVSASASPTLQGNSKWERYTVKGEEFSVMLPELPAMTTSIDEVKRKKRRVSMLGAYSEDVVYSVRTFDNSIGQKWSEFLVDNYSLDRGGIFLESQRDLRLDGFQGKELVVTSSLKREVIQFWATKKNFYIFKTISPKDVVTSTDEFFSSVILGPKQSGQKVTDGVGAHIEDSLPDVEDPEAQSKINRPLDSTLAYTDKDVSRKVVLGLKTEPAYTEEARKNQITGTIVLKAVFSSKGRVVNIRVVSGLRHGLTETAILAARKIRFIPALKEGKHVSVWLTLEYSFNLY